MSNHPGEIPASEIVKAKSCGCRPGSWCAEHRDQAAHDAGKAKQEHDAAKK